MAFHVHDALHAGANKAEIMETAGMVILMGGRPALMYGSKALMQFQKQ
ncbi:carboxymuconolactone decarboxylase family protein [Neolewinella persica]